MARETPAPATPATPAPSPPPPVSPQPSKAKGGVSAKTISSVVVAGLLGAITWVLLSERSKAKKESAGVPRYMPLVIDAANAANIPPRILAGIVTAESGWSNAPNVASIACGVNCVAACVGCTGGCATGLTQVKRAAAQDVGVTGDLCEPANALIAGAKYLRRLYNKYNDWDAAVQAYNRGPGAYDKGSRNSGYLSTVMNAANRFSNQGIAGLGYRQASFPRASMMGIRRATAA